MVRKQKHISKIILCVFFLFSLIPVLSQGQEPEKIEKVIATGVGTDFEKAKQNAIRNALEQVIGTYVTSDTIVKNSMLINDNILAYSGRYVKETNVIFQKKDSDGLFSVKIETSVVGTQLKRKLESLNIATKKIEGGSLFSEAVSRVEEQKTAADLLTKIMVKYPQAAYVIEIGKPEITSTDATTNKANVSIPLTFRWDNSFLAELKDILSRVSKEQLELTPLTSAWETPIIKHLEDNNKILCMSKKGVLKSGNADICWALQHKPKHSEEYNLLNLPTSSTMRLTIFFKDKGTNILEAAAYGMAEADTDNPQKQAIFEGFDPNRAHQLNFFFSKPGWGSPPNILRRGDNYCILLADGVFNLNAKAKVDINNLNNISSMEVHLDPWKN